jgi:hypothetical protein
MITGRHTENNKRICTIDNDREIMIEIDIDDDTVINANYYENGEMLGNEDDFTFYNEYGFGNSYLLQRMYVPERRLGLGRETIEFFKEYYDATVYARTNDGLTRDDGSELTEDAPGFVDKMIDEGILINNQGSYDND